MQIILDCKRFATRNLSSKDRKEYTFNDVGRKSFGFFGKLAVDLNVIFCNLGVCAGYVIFIASNLQVSGSFILLCHHLPPTVVYNMFCYSRTRPLYQMGDLCLCHSNSHHINVLTIVQMAGICCLCRHNIPGCSDGSEYPL